MTTTGGPAIKRRMQRALDKGLVLVADDDLETRAAISELLADLDYWPVTTRNGLEALEYLRRGVEPIAMFIDVYMPLMDGEAFCAELDAQPRLAGIPRVLVSANEETLRLMLTRCRASAWLRKPVSARELLSVMTAVAPSAPKTDRPAATAADRDPR